MDLQSEINIWWHLLLHIWSHYFPKKADRKCSILHVSKSWLVTHCRETDRVKQTKTRGWWRVKLFGMFHIRLSQLTCKIFETGTNANSADLLAPKNRAGFSNELTLTMVGCPEQGWIYGLHGLWIWALKGTMCESQTGELWSEGSGPSRLPAFLCWAEPSLGCFRSTKLTTTAIAVLCPAMPG